MTAVGWRKRQIADLQGLDTSGRWMNSEEAVDEINNAIQQTALDCIEIVKSYGAETFPQERIQDAIKQKYLE
jgi:hypothetical protein